MNTTLKKLILSTSLIMCSTLLHAEDVTQCLDKNYTLQLLGSGGPISDDARASSGALIWWENKPFVLLDTGGGVYLRFGQSGARLEDVSLIAISHLHTDHVTDLPAILMGGFFFKNQKAIQLVGPTGGNGFPSMTEFMDELFNADTGAFKYLNGLYNATDGISLAVKPIVDIDVHSKKGIKVYEKDGMTVWALGIPHGDVPTLAYKFETPKGRIVFSADQNGTNDAFIDFAKDADILVMPLALDEGANAESSFMHAKPSTVGKIAAETKPKVLVLDHFMGKSLVEKNESIKIIQRYYHGPIYAGRDLSCFPITLATDGEK